MPRIQRNEWSDIKRQDTFAVIFERYRGEVWALIYNRVENADTATDMTQEVFRRYFDAWRGGQDIDNIRAWLLCVARHVVADDKKSAYVRKQERDPSLLKTCCSPYPQPFEMLDTEKQRERSQRTMRRLWSELADEERHLLALHVKSHTLEEIGARLGRSRSAVGRRFVHLRARLIRQGGGLPTSMLVEAMRDIIEDFWVASGMQVC